MRTIALSATITVAIAFAASGPAAGSHSPAATPLNDLGSGLYLGAYEGGLYEGGANTAPADHNAAGAAKAAAITPLDAAGAAAPGGKVVLLSVGMSNTTQEFCSASSALPCDPWTFMGLAAADATVNHTGLVIVNGAAGGQTASAWDSPLDANYDRVRDTRLTPSGVTEAQVQAAWVKVANAGPTSSLPAANADAYTLETLTGSVVRAMKARYPNLQMVFLSSRIYAGYATTALNPEPYAYESGLAMKWLVQAQVDQARNGGVIVDPHGGNLGYAAGMAPWLGWGAYLWADGLVPRSDGLTWAATDFAADGTHPSTSGRGKVGDLLFDFFKASSYARCWFLADSDGDGVADVCESVADSDGDGYLDSAEAWVGTDPADACGSLAWPADLVVGGIIDSTNRLTLTDLTSFLAPLRRIDTSPGDGGYDVRWDLVPGPGLFMEEINLHDLTALLAGPTGYPPMFGGVRAFDGPACPSP